MNFTSKNNLCLVSNISQLENDSLVTVKDLCIGFADYKTIDIALEYADVSTTGFKTDGEKFSLVENAYPVMKWYCV